MYISILSPYLRAGVRILDVGCGTADMLNLLNIKCEYYGVDCDEKALQIAKTKGAKTLQVSDFDYEKLHFKKKFDTILLLEILEHLKRPEFLVNQVKKLIKPGGVFLIALPNQINLASRTFFMLGVSMDTGAFLSDKKHMQFPSLQRSMYFISKHFKILKVVYWSDPGGRFEMILSKLPQSLLSKLARTFPNLFARGGIYLCKKK